MKSKNIILSLALACSLIFLPSCIKDLGSYDYKSTDDVLPVKIDSLRDTTLVMGQKLEINPIIHNITDESRYTYRWYAYLTSLGGDVYHLSDTKNLSINISLPPDDYFLYYEVKDTKTQLFVNRSIRVKVTANSISLGWFVLKDKDDVVDFDYISRTGEKTPDVLSIYAPTIKLRGQGVGFAYQSAYAHMQKNEDGTSTKITSQTVYHIATTKDMKTIESKQFKLFKEWNEEFYSAPAVCKPEYLFLHRSIISLVNNGQLHFFSTSGTNVGKFGAALFPKYATSAYLHKEIMWNGSSLGIGFDTISRSFVGFGSSSVLLSTFVNKTGSVSSKNMEYRMISFLESKIIFTSSAKEVNGYAIMQKDTPTDKNYYFIHTVCTANGVGAYPFVTQPEIIPAIAKMPLAPVKTGSIEGLAVYFAYGNQLSSYIHATGLEQREALQKTFPADETVTFLKNMTRAASNVEPIVAAGSDLIVLTNSTRGWKLYAFDVIATGEINPTPRFVYEGTGTARDVFYR